MSKNVTLTILTLCSFLLAATVNSQESATSKPSSIRKPFVPPGFEQLLEPQTTLVDIYYGGQYLTSQLATFTPAELTFLAPEDIVDRLPGLLAPEEAFSALSNPLATNSELVCLRERDNNCGTIITDNLEIIFDEGRFRADLFISPDLTAVRSAGIDKYLPPSDAGASFLHSVSAAANGEKSGNRKFNVTNTTILSYAENRLFAQGNVTSEEGYTIDTLSLQRDFNGLEYQLGIFRAQAANLVFIREADFQGASIASSLDTRRDLDQSSGSELQLFLDSRSRVDIFKDNRLISTSVYDTGNQIINSSELPEGAYDIVLRIRDAFGRVREETRFYIKSNRLPPIDQTLFFFDAGELVQKVPDQTLPEGTKVSIIRTGFSRRIASNFGGEAGVLVQEDDSLMEAGFFNLGRNHELRANFGYGDQGDKGFNFYSRFRAGQITFTSNYRRVWLKTIPVIPSASLLGEELSQSSASINAPLGRGFINISGRYNKRGLITDRNLGIKYNFTQAKFGKTLLGASIQLSKDNDNYQLLISASLRFQKGKWQTEYAPRYYSEEKAGARDSRYNSRLSTTWQDDDTYMSDISMTLRAEEEDSVKTMEANIDVAGHYGRGTMDIVHVPDTNRTTYGVNLFTTFLANSNTFSIGGKSLTQAALVMDVDGEAEDAYFDVLLNKGNRGSIDIGTKSVINVRPFDTYEVSLLARGGSLLDFNNQIQTATLYPGNVVTMKWVAKKIVVAFGQIMRGGQPVANGLIKGVTGLAITDEFGIFQAEMESSVKEITVQTRQYSCKVQLPDIDAGKDIAVLGELDCL